jgi:hypothetical protein
MYHTLLPQEWGISTDEFCEENMKRKQENEKEKEKGCESKGIIRKKLR